MTDKPGGAREGQGPEEGREPEKAGDKAADSGLGDSIYPPTSTFYAGPELNQGVPADPGFIKVLSSIEIAIGVTLFASSSSASCTRCSAGTSRRSAGSAPARSPSCR